MKTSAVSMGQRIAKHQMQSGVRLYHQRHHHRAIAKWRRALRRLSSPGDRFVTLGYIAQAYGDASDYESMLHYSLQQMEIANARHDDHMKSEAFLNLSKAYERLADFSKAISYGRASLQHPAAKDNGHGYAYLSVALAHMGFSQFQTSLEAFEKAMTIANDTGDKLLELQICVGLGALFTLLRDLTKALIFLKNALSILQLITVDTVHAKYKSSILFHLSVVLRHKGALGDAREACEEALRLSQDCGMKGVYARCLCSLADIYREIGESEARETITKSWARYEQAFRIMREISDRMGEVVVLGSMAKSASESRSHYTGQCECQAIQLNKKCLEISKLIGCKHAMMKCHQRLQELYLQLNDEDSEEVARKTAIALIQEMELFCNFCGQRYGLNDDSLQALRCSHIFHEKCLHEFLHDRESPTCPKCQCKAILMENVSLGTSSASSNNENEPIQHPSFKEDKPTKEPPLGGIQTCFLQANAVPNHHPSISEEAAFSQSFQPDPTVTIHSAKPVILVQQPSQETSDEATSSSGIHRPRIVPTGSATPVICRVSHTNDNRSIPSAVVTRQKSPIATIKGPKPPPPPRKPNCNTHSFPPLPPELLVGIGAAPTESSNTDTIRPQGPGITDV